MPMSEDMIRWLYGLQHFGMKLGLDNIRALLDELDHPEAKPVVALIAGTNGKGSVSSMIDALLAAHDVPSGMFTSPHLVHPTERIRLNGEDIGRDEFDRRLAAMRERIETALAAGRLEAHPSFFEVVTATSLEAFRDHDLRAAVLEVGLGGRLDATNAVEAEVPVIVSIGLDHTKTLGPTLRDIAGEKAGIIKSDRPLISGVTQQAALDVIHAACRKHGAPFIDARDRVSFEGRDGDLFHLSSPAGDFPRLKLSLPGRHQIDNARIALAAFERMALALDVTIEADRVRHGLASVRWPGRLQWLDPGDGGPRLLFDGAHNPAGMETLCAYLDELDLPKPFVVFGATRGKPLDQLLLPLAARAQSVLITRPPVEKGLLAEDVADEAGRWMPRPEAIDDPFEAVHRAREQARHQGDGSYVLVTGSLYLVGDVLGHLSGRPVPGPVAM